MPSARVRHARDVSPCIVHGPKQRGSGRSASGWLFFAIAMCVVVVCAAAVGVAGAVLVYAQQYAGRIYPGVHVNGIGLGGKTIDEATAALRSSLPAPADLPLTLRSGQMTWTRSWAELGLQFDPRATAELAYGVGRRGPLTQQVTEQFRARLSGWPIAPVVILPQSDRAAALLGELAPALSTPPVNAGLVISPTGVSPTPAQAGRALDLEETVRLLPYLTQFGPGGLVIDVLTRQVPPAILNPGPVQTQVEALLSRPFVLTAHDELTEFTGTWQVPTATVASWLKVEAREDESGARLVLSVQEEPLRITLEALNAELPGQLDAFPYAKQFGLAIDVGVSVHQVRAAVETGAMEAPIALFHPPCTHVVQAGETLMSIARSYGFPLWRLIEANPGLDTRILRPGESVIIPSVDILFPFPLIKERRIVVDLSEQHLYAYEGEALIYDFIASTGIPSSPTMPGVFQVLSKEPEAYASNWDLLMPYFIGIYQAGPDFVNGIHGMPRRSSGAQVWWQLGRPASFGCVVIGLEDAAKLFDWAELGTMVVIQP